MNITVKNVPSELRQRIKESAKYNGRSLNKTILHALERFFLPREESEASLLKRIGERRGTQNVWLTTDKIEETINEGRM